ncbi:hypothetical protein Moror_14569 [Moniliophthora roreri MCA 2997]|uniref:Uncharacterized protein n=1 Tax=Moniliophthora roreri (strain MCA 2997) TaxID=1381753 RepID=V2XLA6_MONRO|nr:hypothetical protein Moror_14569 [Moniliophthora roreri MCA 2997]KAI3607079.1 hypothetical protein WG66_007873 [Moniliophthora roreri]
MREATPAITPPKRRRNLFKLGFGRHSSAASDVSITVLSTLKDASMSGPIPSIGIACALALEILKAAQAAKDNKDAFKRLAKDSCSMVLQIKMVCEDLSAADDMGDSIIERRERLSLMLLKHLEGLEETLTEIRDFAKRRASRGFWKRYCSNKSDLGRIQEYRERVRQALDVFGIQSHIIVRETMVRMASQQQSLQEELRSWGSLERADTSELTMSSVSEETNNPFTSSITSTSSSFSFEDAFKDLLESANDEVVPALSSTFTASTRYITLPVDEKAANPFISSTSSTNAEDSSPSPPPYTRPIGSPTGPKNPFVFSPAHVYSVSLRTTRRIKNTQTSRTASPFVHFDFHLSIPFISFTLTCARSFQAGTFNFTTNMIYLVFVLLAMSVSISLCTASNLKSIVL